MPEDEAAPVDTAMDSPPGTPAATEDAHADPPFALETKKVFVLHADSRVGGVLGRAFRDAGCDVRGVRDGERPRAASAAFTDDATSPCQGKSRQSQVSRIMRVMMVRDGVGS